MYGEKVRRAKGAKRKEQVLLAQLRAGHCPKTRYYQKRVGISEDGRCERCGEEEEKDHWVECSIVSDVWINWCAELERERSRERGYAGVVDERRGRNTRNPNLNVGSVVGHLGDEDLVGGFLRRAYPEWLA